MMIKIKKYTGRVLGFNYDFETEEKDPQTNKEELQAFLKTKLERYVLQDVHREIIEEILGITQIKQDIEKIKEKLGM